MSATAAVAAPLAKSSATTSPARSIAKVHGRITTVGLNILLRSQDVIRLAECFLESSGPNYSFADISIIDLATELRRSGRTVKILAFDGQLWSYSD